VMSGLYFMDEVPFRDVVITGLVRDRHGKPMHKSSGNVVDPLDLIARYGADAVRFGLMRMATGGQDMPLSEDVIEAARRFANKIWNAARLVLTAYEGGPPELPAEEAWTLTDRWLLSRHQACLEEVDQALDEYRFVEAAQAIHRFVWSEYCDWALEAAKRRLYEGSAQERRDAAGVLAWVLERSLRMLHPIMPFVTEEIWQRFAADGSIMVAPWPEQQPEHRDGEAEAGFGFAAELISAVRRFRKAHGLPDSRQLAVRVLPSRPQRDVLEALRPEVVRLAAVSELEVLPEPADRSGSAHLLVAGAEVLIPLAGVLDLEVERARLAKRLADVRQAIAGSERKLSGQGFVSKAPPEVVARERERLSALRDESATLADQLEELG
jgi:valyl-tRNA synthetase